MFLFYTTLKHQKVKGFSGIFSDTKWEYWLEMVNMSMLLPLDFEVFLLIFL